MTRTLPLTLAATSVFVLSWILRYNEPEGSFGGLTDDHLFYAVQGWQLLFGEWPDRDFNDPGAPLTYVTSAALQVLLGRSVWSEYVFCVTALAAGAALTCVLGARATGSTLLGIAAAVFEIALRPRLYNYPKILIYAIAIAALWSWMAKPGTRRTWLLAGITAFAFLMRHDHGLYVAAATGVALLAVRGLPGRSRLRLGLIYGCATLLFLVPYFGYLQVNGGAVNHFAAGARYSARDYDRAPLVLPVQSWRPLFPEGAPADDATPWWDRSPFTVLDADYATWWLYWLFVALPVVAVLLLVANRGTGPPERGVAWPQIVVVAVLAAILDYRMLRGNLGGRLADVAVPMSVLAVWVGAAGFRSRVARWPLTAIVVVAALCTGSVLVRSTALLIRDSSLADGPTAALRDARLVTRRTERTWPLDLWTEETTGQIGLARYLQACTAPGDRVLMAPFAPVVYGLAQRGFAGGRLDLRGGFYDAPEEQRVTVERLQRQSVPIVIGPPSTGVATFANEFPAVAEWLNREYRSAGDYDFGGGLTFALLLHREATVAGEYEPLSLPCLR